MSTGFDPAELAPGVPEDYYSSLYEAELRHWWHRGMIAITEVLLDRRLSSRGQRLLDAGCGTGGFLRWALETRSFERAVGVDISAAGVRLARQRVPLAELHVAPVWDLPLASESFDLVVMNDVLQHLPEPRVEDSLRELRRVLVAGGTLFVRTNGAWRARREREDWRAYDRELLAATLASAGFRSERITHANLAPSLWALVRRRSPRAPTEQRHGIAAPASPSLRTAIAFRLLRTEARYLASGSRSLPYGHTLFAVATPQ